MLSLLLVFHVKHCFTRSPIPIFILVHFFLYYIGFLFLMVGQVLQNIAKSYNFTGSCEPFIFFRLYLPSMGAHSVALFHVKQRLLFLDDVSSRTMFHVNFNNVSRGTMSDVFSIVFHVKH